MALKNIFVICLGNKTNDIKYFKQYLPLDVERVVEPFAGSFAVIRNIYYEDKYIKHINDNNIDLINIYNNLDEFKTELAQVIKHVNDNNLKSNKNIRNYIYNNPSGLGTSLNGYKHKDYLLKCTVKRGINTCSRTNIDKIDFTNLKLFLSKCIITSDDYIKILNQYNDEKTFVFIDPPYLASFNCYYKMGQDCDLRHNPSGCDDKSKIIDNTAMYIKIRRYMERSKCKVMLIINSNYINRHIYKKFIVGSYERIYQLTKKKEVLLICCNFNPSG
jgi:site-specific DNA-adenine methylase